MAEFRRKCYEKDRKDADSGFAALSLCGSAFAGETESGDLTSGPEEEVQSLTKADQDQECEWNILVYLCGTDLETSGGSATKNLVDIAATVPDDSVNLLVETGGAREWNSSDRLGIEIANDRLQRWYYGEDGFVLVDEAEETEEDSGACFVVRDVFNNAHYSDYVALNWNGETVEGYYLG